MNILLATRLELCVWTFLTLGGAAVSLSTPIWAATKAGPKPKPLCFMSGEVRERNKLSSGFENLGNAIRLRFESTTADDCKLEMQAYCFSEIQRKNRVIVKLTGYFKNTNMQVNYVVNDNCSVQDVREGSSGTEKQPQQ